MTIPLVDDSREHKVELRRKRGDYLVWNRVSYRKVRMNKRLLKRHKREVPRAKGQVKASEPDVRTPEQIRAAREASRPVGDRSDGANVHMAPRGPRNGPPRGTGSAAKIDV